jgi:hypothetical protein
MDNSRDPENGPAPSNARVEHDIEGPLTRVRGRSVPRLPAALPLALAGILVVASVAFGATVVRTVINPAVPTPVVIGGDDETPTPPATATPTPTPPEEATPTPVSEPIEEATPTPTTETTPGALTLTVETSAGKAKLTWTAYTGDDFAYYKVVRSTDTTVSWPLGAGDKLIAAIDNKATLTFTDCSGAGTFSYAVFAVKSSDNGYEVLASSNTKTVVVPAATKPPVNTASLGTLRVKDNGNGTYTFSWNAYAGSADFNYYKLSGVPYPGAPGYAEGKGYWAVIDSCKTSVTVDGKAGTWNFNVEAIYYPNGKTTALARTTTLKVTMTGKEQPTAPPVASLSLTATLQADNTVKLHWSQYTGPYFYYYGIVRTEGSTAPVPTEIGQIPPVYFDNVGTTSYTDTGKGPLGKLLPGHTYHYIVFAFSEETFASVSSGGAVPACNVGYVLAISAVVDVTIPEAAPTPEPTPEATPTPAE